jgi:EAL domain-containing protein (putative c-di-GMP-specific phosphodiesterase class I)/GGDEF domain-containing protein
MAGPVARRRPGGTLDLNSGRIDPISLLPNRHQFNADQVYWPRMRATMVLVTLADARGFNAILRALGHARSEAFIRAGAQRLHGVLGHSTKLYNVSILSFVFRFPGLTAPDRHPIIDCITEAFREPLIVDDIPITTQIGIGLKASNGPGAAEDLRAALSAAQESRSAPQGWAWYDPHCDATHVRAFRLLTDLKEALAAERQLHLVYQPKVALADGRCIGAEALVRWTHPHFGPVSPGEFVPLVEATALVKPMTRWVVTAAVGQAAAWQRDGLDLRLAINVSPRNLEESDFIDFLCFTCEQRGVENERIEIEVTEGVNAAQGPLILERLATLNRRGFSIAIDDFGSGYSNMSYLTRLSADTLKIDQSLVRDMAPDHSSGRLVAGIVQMGHDLGYKVVAEGIETEEQRALLARWGCDIGQGYLFSRPLEATAFADWYAAQTPAARTVPVRRA